MADVILSLYDVSAKLGVSPSAIKKRVANLNLPVERGARGKLLFNREAYALLVKADEMLKAGAGFDDCRRALGLDGAAPVVLVEDEPEVVAIVEDTRVDETLVEVELGEPEPIAVAEPAPVAEEAPAPIESPGHEVSAAQAEVLEVVVPVAEAPAEVGVRAYDQALPAPVFIQLGRRKPSESVRMRMIEHQPTPTPMPAAPAPAPVEVSPEPVAVEAPRHIAPAVSVVDPDLIARLDAALKLIEDKDRQNQVLQSKLLVTYDEMTKLSATAAAFQERSMNLQHEVQKLQGEIKLLSAPPERKPWWKFWG